MFQGYASLLRDRAVIADTLAKHDGRKAAAVSGSHPLERPGTVVDRVHPALIRWRVATIRDETASTKTLVLVPLGGVVPAFLPGQYLNVFVELAGARTSRPQSISSSPDQRGSVEITVKDKPGGFVSHHLVRALAAGDELTTSGPEGDLYFNPARDRESLLFIAGGSGITPFMGMAEYVLGRYPASRITLLYDSRSPRDVIFAARLAELESRHSGRLKVVVVISSPDESWPGERGRIDRALIARHVPSAELLRASIFLCGPRPMQEQVLRELASLGVPPARVQVESSGVADDVTALAGWPGDISRTAAFEVAVPGRRSPVRAEAGEPLIVALERAGIDVPALCRNGVCGTCRRKVLGGSVYLDPAVTMRASDREAGYVLLCSSYPLSDIVLARC